MGAGMQRGRNERPGQKRRVQPIRSDGDAVGLVESVTRDTAQATQLGG
jgi:hypothetical protein